jgi:hypothetical protein
MEENERKIVFEDDNVIVVDVQQASDIEYYAPDDIKESLVKDWVQRFRDGDFYIIVDKNSVWARYYVYRDLDGDLTYYNDDFDDEGYLDFIDKLKSQKLDSVIPIINEIKGHGRVYQSLLDIKNGKVTEFPRYYDFSDIDEDNIISKIKIAERNPGKSLITLTFEDEEEFLKMFDDISDDDIWFIKAVFSYYDGYEFMDSYRAEEDWGEGYLIRYFGTENIDKIREILKYINPNLLNFDLSNDDESQEVSKLLYDLYPNEIGSICSDYASNLNSAANEEAKNEITNDFCNILLPYYIIKVDCMSKYVTSVNLLLKLYDDASSTDLTLMELFKESFYNIKVPSGYYEHSYEYGYNGFNQTAFDNDVKYELDKIFTQVTEDYSEDTLQIYQTIIAKFGINKNHPIPASEGYSFKILRVDTDDDTVVIRKFKTTDPWGASEDQSYTLETFNDFLHNYKLIESNRMKKVIREQLEKTENKEVLNFLKVLPPITEKKPLDYLKDEINNYNRTTGKSLDLSEVLKATTTPTFPFKLDLFGVQIGDTQQIIKTLSYNINPKITFTLTINPIWKKNLPGVNIKF